MSYRARLLAAFLIATLLPLVLFAAGVRQQLTRRVTAQHERRVAAMVSVAEQDLERQGQDLAQRLASIAEALPNDNRARLGIVGSGSANRSYLLDYAAGAMRLAGLDMLQIQDADGRILSSGHFRNEFDRLEPELPRLLTAARGPVLVRARTPDGAFLVLAAVDSVLVGGHSVTIVGGISADRAMLARLQRNDDLTAHLVLPGVSDSSATRDSSARVAATIPLDFVDAASLDSSRLQSARIVIEHSPSELIAIRRDVSRWFLGAAAAAVAGALLFSLWMSARLSRPLEELARATSRIELEGPEIELATARDDELGVLARRLGAMTRRLRASAGRLRDAERLATVGEMARQVNHDIKNGLIPIRNVLRHLGQVQEREPGSLGTVFAERRPTLESSLEYLDDLARRYARLTPRIDQRVFEVNSVVVAAVQASVGTGVSPRTELSGGLAQVYGDPVLLRRILDNLIRNAIESLTSPEDSVIVRTAAAASAVRIQVADTGRGMTETELARAFDDFVTNKPGGTGLGLSVVRRLVADLHGSLKVESAPGKGTTITIELPAAPRRANVETARKAPAAQA